MCVRIHGFVMCRQQLLVMYTKVVCVFVCVCVCARARAHSAADNVNRRFPDIQIALLMGAYSRHRQLQGRSCADRLCFAFVKSFFSLHFFPS
jgi:hypothetical protein